MLLPENVSWYDLILHCALHLSVGHTDLFKLSLVGFQIESTIFLKVKLSDTCFNATDSKSCIPKINSNKLKVNYKILLGLVFDRC